MGNNCDEGVIFTPFYRFQVNNKEGERYEMSYLNEFKEALQRNARLGLESPNFIYEDARYLGTKFLTKFPDLILNTLGRLDPKDLTATCIPIHQRLQT